MGRPPEYKPEYCQMLIDHMSKGFSYESFSAKIDTSRVTLYNWEKQYEEFLYAKRLGMERCQAWWEEQGHKGLFEEKDTPKLQASLWMFNMKARFRWKDTDPTPNEVPLSQQPLTLEDKKKMLIQGEEELKKLREELEKVNG